MATPRKPRAPRAPKLTVEAQRRMDCRRFRAPPLRDDDPLTDEECTGIRELAKSRALKSFLTAKFPLTLADARAFWAIFGTRYDTGDVLYRSMAPPVVTDRGGNDPRLPSLSTCYGLYNLNKLLCDRFPE